MEQFLRDSIVIHSLNMSLPSQLPSVVTVSYHITPRILQRHLRLKMLRYLSISVQGSSFNTIGEHAENTCFVDSDFCPSL